LKSAAYLLTLPLIPSRKRLCRNWQNIAFSYFRHSGLDPWFDALTTLSKVEGESIIFSECYATGCRIKSGMTG
jgi:hypothetical protein